jgi:DNA-binding transcriptional LysR family regulator
MDLRQLEYVVAVSEELNFTRAAGRCHIAQSGLSHQVHQLEKEIGAQLFERTSRAVRLTPTGQVFLPYARRLLHDAEEAFAEVAALHGTIQGTLHVGSIPFTAGDVDLLGLLRSFQEAYPAVEVTVSDEGSLTTVASILAGSTDVAFVGLFAHQSPARLVHQILSLEPLVAVVGQDHPLRGTGQAALGALARDRFLESHPDSGLRAQVDAACLRANVRRAIVCELRNPADLAALALQGLGVAVVPRRVARAVVTEQLEGCILRLTDPQALQPVALVHRDPGPSRKPVRAFLNLIRARWPQLSEPTTPSNSSAL